MQQALHGFMVGKIMKPIQECKWTQNLCCESEIADKANKDENFSDAV